jgi:hypothetical protein
MTKSRQQEKGCEREEGLSSYKWEREKMDGGERSTTQSHTHIHIYIYT